MTGLTHELPTLDDNEMKTHEAIARKIARLKDKRSWLILEIAMREKKIAKISNEIDTLKAGKRIERERGGK